MARSQARAFDHARDRVGLGALFGETSDMRDRTELLVLITPRVVSNQDEARAVTDEPRVNGDPPSG